MVLQQGSPGPFERRRESTASISAAICYPRHRESRKWRAAADIAASACDVRNVPIRPVAVTAPFFDCPGISDEICDCPCSLFVERPTPCARTYANQSVEDSREVALIAEAARQGHIRQR